MDKLSSCRCRISANCTSDSSHSDTISVVFKKVPKVVSTGQNFFSDPFKMLHHNWKMSISREKAEDGTLTLGAYIWAPKNESPMWEIVADISFTIISNDVAIKNCVKKAAGKRFSHKGRARGFRAFMPWETHEDIKAFVTTDDKMEISVDLTIRRVTGYRKHQSFDFTTENPRHDLTLRIEGKTLFASKAMLAAHSSMLDRMLFGGFIESRQDEVELNDVDYDTFHELLHLIYPADRDLTDDIIKLNALLKTADYLEMKTVVDKIERHLIGSNKVTIAAKLKLSGDYCLVDLQNHCLATFKDIKSIKQLDQTPEYKNYNEATKLALFEKMMKLKE